VTYAYKDAQQDLSWLRAADDQIGEHMDGPDPKAPCLQFWVIVAGSKEHPPRVREVEAIPISDSSEEEYWCRTVRPGLSEYHRLHRDQLYDDPKTAEQEAAEAILGGDRLTPK